MWWRSDGTLEGTCEWKEGMKNGIEKEYDKTGQEKTAELYFEEGKAKLSGEDLSGAKSVFENVVNRYPASSLGAAAKQQLSKIESKLRMAEKIKIDAARKPWRTKAKRLHSQIYDQALRDMGQGTSTRVIDLITQIIGEPSGSYDGGHGFVKYYVWDMTFGNTPSSNDLDKAPFYIIFAGNDLRCGDYCKGICEYYSYGKKINVSDE